MAFAWKPGAMKRIGPEFYGRFVQSGFFVFDPDYAIRGCTDKGKTTGVPFLFFDFFRVERGSLGPSKILPALWVPRGGFYPFSLVFF